MDRPLRRTLEERYARTVGAREKAAASVADAERQVREYGEKLRAARVELAQGREKQVALWNAERDKALREAREAAQTRVREARAGLEADGERSRAAMDPAIDALAGQILTAVLPAAEGAGRRV